MIQTPTPLDYQTPIAPNARRRIPISFWLICTQIPWWILLAICLGHSGPKRQVFDTVTYALIAIPSLGAVLFSLRELWPWHLKNRSTLTIMLSTIALIAGIYWTHFYFGLWHEMWIDPKWDWHC